eukprot:CAMPEP_0184291858 /NCGR_PEP_ID=MMETSP1049-20130417/3736_1 /TAXON_ID=77928 /ORGANISM="Proteomonas sulcata, Strain CCMP704" /LENGTH=39 /DNA_ID= /DNA_START= /DNA_END= /DNA_ORIENTATION=
MGQQATLNQVFGQKAGKLFVGQTPDRAVTTDYKPALLLN